MSNLALPDSKLSGCELLLLLLAMRMLALPGCGLLLYAAADLLIHFCLQAWISPCCWPDMCCWHGMGLNPHSNNPRWALLTSPSLTPLMRFGFLMKLLVLSAGWNTAWSSL